MPSKLTNIALIGVATTATLFTTVALVSTSKINGVSTKTDLNLTSDKQEQIIPEKKTDPSPKETKKPPVFKTGALIKDKSFIVDSYKRNLKTQPISIAWSYSLLLISPYESAESEESFQNQHKELWTKKFTLWQDWKNKKPGELHNSFKDVEKGFDNTNIKALNKKCEGVYRNDDPNYPSAKETSTKSKNLIKNLFAFCTYLEDLPKVIENQGSDKVLKEIYYLLPTLDTQNDIYWEIKEEWRNRLEKVDVPFNDKDKKLKDICNENYNKPSKENPSLKDLLLKYCSFAWTDRNNKQEPTK